MAPQLFTIPSKPSRDILQLKLDVQQKHKRALIAHASAMFFAVSVILTLILQFMEQSEQYPKYLAGLRKLLTFFLNLSGRDDENSLPDNITIEIIDITVVWPLLFVMLFAFASLYCAARAFLFGCTEHVIARNYSELEKDNDEDVYKWLDQEYKREKKSVSKMFYYMQQVSASLICASISGAMFFLAAALEPEIPNLRGIKEIKSPEGLLREMSEVGKFFIVFVVAFTPGILILKAWFTSAFAVNHFHRKLNSCILAYATAVWALMAFLLALTFIFMPRDSFGWIPEFFIFASFLIIIAYSVTLCFLINVERKSFGFINRIEK